MKHLFQILLLTLFLFGCSRTVTVTIPGGDPGGTPPSAAPSLIGGASVGNGSDLLDEGPALALGDAPIKWCIVERNFGLEPISTRNSIRSAFKLWRDYFVSRDINNPAAWVERLLDPSDPKLVGNDEFLDRCNGTEELTFFLGEENAQIRRDRKKFENPIAFMRPLSQSSERIPHKAYIWIAAQGMHSSGGAKWSEPEALTAVVTHELGHFHGTQHKANTIMAEDLPQQIARGDFPKQIDGKSQLLRCVHCGRREYFGTNRVSEEMDLFELVMRLGADWGWSRGLPVVGTPGSARLELIETGQDTELTVHWLENSLFERMRLFKIGNDDGSDPTPVFKVSYVSPVTGASKTFFSRTTSARYQTVAGAGQNVRYGLIEINRPHSAFLTFDAAFNGVVWRSWEFTPRR